MSAVSRVTDKYSDLVIVTSDSDMQKTVNWIDSAPTEQDVKNSSLLNKLIRYNQKYKDRDYRQEGNNNIEDSKKDT